MRIGSLFSGAAGLDMAVAEVFGGEVVWHAEIDKAASKVLAHRFFMVPNLGDISAVDWADVPEVDVLCGGFPCQDVSAAGKRAGIKDGTRSGLWAVFADIIDALRPRYVVIENVRGLLSATAHRAVESDDAVVGDAAGRPVLRAAGAVLGDLADLGYDAQWTTLAAAAVGAPHRRERVFIFASATNAQEVGREGHQQRNGMAPPQPKARSTDVSFPHSARKGRDEGRPESAGIAGGFDAAIRSDEPGVALLPTPCVVDRLATGEMTLEEWDESRRSQKERGVGSFGPRGDSLGAAILRVEEGSERPDYSTTKARRAADDGVALLPTPGTMDDREKRTTHAGGNLTLQGAVVGVNPVDVERHSRAGRTVSGDEPGVALLPTPRTSDTNGAGHHGDGGMDLRTTVTLLPTPNAVESSWGKYAPAIARWENLTRPAPAPTEPNSKGNPRLSAAFSQWLMGWPDGWVTDPAIGISRNDQLRIVGNGVCPQQATAALRHLLAVNA